MPGSVQQAMRIAPDPGDWGASLARCQGADYISVMLFGQRQGGVAVLAVVTGALYGLGPPVADRAPLRLLLAVASVLFTLVNANHAGVPLLGNHPRVSRHGEHVGMLFAPFRAASSALNIPAFDLASQA